MTTTMHHYANHHHLALWFVALMLLLLGSGGVTRCVYGIQFQPKIEEEEEGHYYHYYLKNNNTAATIGQNNNNNNKNNASDIGSSTTSGIAIADILAAEEAKRRVRGRGTPLMVGLTLIPFAAAKGAVCLDGTLPGYHLHRGFGSGANNWLIQLEGGGWCNNRRTCVFRKTTRRGSSKYMEKVLPFTGILSNKREENPDFYNWNRAKIRYCDGASFSGEGYDQATGLFFRGQRIWSAAMEELMSKGMRSAKQALLSGCSAGGLSSILHCDEFRSLFPGSTKVKCLGDAGLFLDVVDVAGVRALRTFFNGVVTLQGAGPNLPRTCTNHKDETSCFFPQNLLRNIQTPLFLLNSAYDLWQIYEGIAPPSADVHGSWKRCKKNHASCSSDQLSVLQGFRNQMVHVVKAFSASGKNGLFINSCFAHCQSELQDTWFASNSPRLGKKRIAEAVGDWYFDRTRVNTIDCPYPCDKTCHNLN